MRRVGFSRPVGRWGGRTFGGAVGLGQGLALGRGGPLGAGSTSRIGVGHPSITGSVTESPVSSCFERHCDGTALSQAACQGGDYPEGDLGRGEGSRAESKEATGPVVPSFGVAAIGPKAGSAAVCGATL